MSAKFLLDPEEYWAIHDVTLHTTEGTIQIDHVFVSRYGVFVVETKNYAGWIFENEKDAYWTQKLFKTSNKFQNSLRQYEKHLKESLNKQSTPITLFWLEKRQQCSQLTEFLVKLAGHLRPKADLS